MIENNAIPYSCPGTTLSVSRAGQPLSDSLEPLNGCGEYRSSLQIGNFARGVKCAAKIALYILLGIAVIGAAVQLHAICALSSLIAIPAACIGAGFSAVRIIKLCLEVKGINHIAPSTDRLIPDPVEKSTPSLEKFHETSLKCSPFTVGSELFSLKKEMIRKAEQEILISGNYCGGRAFCEILDEIGQQMEDKPDLRVFVLSANRFLEVEDAHNTNNWEKIEALAEKYPDRFFMTLSFETVQANPCSPGFKFISNHAKLMICDRQAMISGGSAVQDRWAYSDETIRDSTAKEMGIFDQSLAKSFNDKDILFYRAPQDENKSLIDRSALEFYKLFTRWHHFSETIKRGHPLLTRIRNGRREGFEKNGLEVKETDTFPHLYQDLDRRKNLLNAHTLNAGKSYQIEQLKVFMQGPEKEKNALEKELISLINLAKERIIINHMFFHPTSDIRDALEKAANRGVAIDILTNDRIQNSPLVHQVFAPRSINNARTIARSEKEKNEEEYKVNLFYWNVEFSTNHSKNIIIDSRYVLGGSSNLGYKGFNSMSDYEHDALIDSPQLGAEMARQFDQEVQLYAKQYDPEQLRERPSIHERVFTGIHWLFQSMIG